MTTEASLFGLTDKKEMVIGGCQGRVRACSAPQRMRSWPDEGVLSFQSFASSDSGADLHVKFRHCQLSPISNTAKTADIHSLGLPTTQGLRYRQCLRGKLQCGQ